jgi:hypothetical protein
MCDCNAVKFSCGTRDIGAVATVEIGLKANEARRGLRGGPGELCNLFRLTIQVSKKAASINGPVSVALVMIPN